MERTQILSLAGLAALYIALATQYVAPAAGLYFFGMNAGAVVLGGAISIEHEWVGLGIVVVGLVLWWKEGGDWFAYALIALGAILAVTDYAGLLGINGEAVSLLANPIGSGVSVFIGGATAVLIRRAYEG